MTAPATRRVDALTGRIANTAFFTALDNADGRIAERSELYRQLDQARLDMQATQDIADKYAAEADRLDRDNEMLRAENQELRDHLTRTEHLLAELLRSTATAITAINRAYGLPDNAPIHASWLNREAARYEAHR